MKFFVFIALALLGCAAAAQLPDSATQGPNPQDIATPEPEYIDIEDPAPAPVAASRPVAQFQHQPLPLARPIARPVAVAPPQTFVHHQQPIAQRVQYVAAQSQSLPQQVAGHAYSSQIGYQYRRPVYVRRVYRQRRY